MPIITPVAGRNVLLNPSMLSTASWGDVFFTTTDGTVVRNQIFSTWNDVYAMVTHVVDGGANALLFAEHTNYPNTDGGPQLGNAADFLVQAGQEWRVVFRWKRITAESHRIRIRPWLIGGTLDGSNLQINGPWSSIATQYGTASVDWRFTVPRWWYDAVKWGSSAIGWTHGVETMFGIDVWYWAAGPQYPDFNITDPHTDPNFAQFDFQFELFAVDAHWTGNYRDPSTTVPSEPPTTDPPVVPPPGVDPTPTPGPGEYMENLCGTFPGDIFSDAEGNYMGNAGLGDGPGGPYGWSACTFYSENPNGITRFYEFSPCISTSLRPAIQFALSVQTLTSIVDDTGPPGLEQMLAMQVDLAGTPAGVATWAGAPVYDDGSGSWATGTFFGPTLWVPVAGQMWVYQAWVKAVPDDDGYVISPAVDLQFSIAVEGFTQTPFGDTFHLTGDWQFIQYTWTWFPTGYFSHIGEPGYPEFVWPGLYIRGDELERKEHYTMQWFGVDVDKVGFFPKGRYLVKCPHLYPIDPPLPPGVWINEWVGRENL